MTKQFPHQVCERRRSSIYFYLERAWQTSNLAQEMTSSSLKQKKEIYFSKFQELVQKQIKYPLVHRILLH